MKQNQAQRIQNLSRELEESKSLVETVVDDIAVLQSELAEIRPLVRKPGMMITGYQAKHSGVDNIASQAEALGRLTNEALSEFCLRNTGDEFEVRDFAENIGYGVKGFCQSIAIQLRGTVAVEPEKPGAEQ